MQYAFYTGQVKIEINKRCSTIIRIEIFTWILLGHVEQRFVVIEPEIVVRYRHLVEGNFLRVFKEAVGPPDVVQPIHVEYPIILRHVLRQPQPRVPPALREKYVGHVRLPPWKNNVNRCGTSRKIVCADDIIILSRVSS